MPKVVNTLANFANNIFLKKKPMADEKIYVSLQIEENKD